MVSLPRPHAALSFLVAALLCLSGTSCRRPGKPKATPAPRPAPVEFLSYMKGSHIGTPAKGEPWVTHVTTVDLDKDGRLDVLATEGKDHTVLWLRQTAPGLFEEKVLASDMRAPVRVEPCDMDKDGDLDLVVSSMGYIFPNNDKIGTLYILENDGRQNFRKRIIAENIMRVTDARGGDLNGDGRMDIAVAQFGYDQGEVQWFECTGDWTYKAHKLLDLSGAINICIADMDRNTTPDLTVQISQQWEEIYLFSNDGRGNFTKKVIYGSTNEDLGSSNMTVCDLNKDGLVDVLFSAGDGFGPVGVPGPRPWHGVMWLQNKGGNNFAFNRVGDLGGAYCPQPVDLDMDGHLDVVAVANFNDWTNPRSASLMWYRNDGSMNFAPRILANTPTHLLMVTVGDFDGSGKPQFVTGGFHGYPPYDRLSRLMYWKRSSP